MTVRERLAAVEDQIRAACQHAGRARSEVTLVAVSKTHPVTAVTEAIEAGQLDLGESYAQELREKSAAIEVPVRWHFIGRLQSNKARDVAAVAHLVHSVDRLSLVHALDRAATGPLDVLIQVNSGGELSKGGCTHDEAASLVRAAAASTHLRPVGLMTIPPPADDAEEVRPYFAALRQLRSDIVSTLRRDAPRYADSFVHLSMGMSDDLSVAIEEGATMVRVGTAIFGARSYS